MCGPVHVLDGKLFSRKYCFCAPNFSTEIRLLKLAVRHLPRTRVIKKPREVRLLRVPRVNPVVVACRVVDSHPQNESGITRTLQKQLPDIFSNKSVGPDARNSENALPM